MSKNKTDLELIDHKKEAVNEVDNFLNSLISSESPIDKSKADKLSYWLEDYIRFLRIESEISSAKFKRYKRGQVIKVHLGFNVGSEEGGLHYALVISNNDSIKSPVVHIVPLTSVKSTTEISKIRTDLGQVYIGNELHVLLSQKNSETEKNIVSKLKELEQNVTHMEFDLQNNIEKIKSNNNISLELIKENLSDCKKQLKVLKKATKEINKMKKRQYSSCWTNHYCKQNQDF